MAWKIDRDYLDGKDSRTIGTQSVGPDLTGDTYRFRLLDDDMEVYYGGKYDETAAYDDESEGGLYECERWGGYYAGAIHLQIRVRDALKFNLTSQDYVDRYNLSPSNWVTIYG